MRYGKTYYQSVCTKFWINELKKGNYREIEEIEQNRKLLLISDLITSFKKEGLNKRIQYTRRLMNGNGKK